MQPETPMMAQQGTASTTRALAQNRVLRNTYWLLSLSLLPTILGAWLAVAFKINLLSLGHPALGFVLFLAIAFGFMFAIEKTKHSVAGVFTLLGFTAFMGVVLGPLLSMVLGFANGWNLIALAFGGTAAVFAAMATIATTTKRDLSGMGKFLFIGVIMLLVASFANIFLHIPALMIATSLIAIAIFSAYMVWDVNRIVTGGETNYITATLALYLDIYNVFANLLALLGIFGGDNR